MTVSVDKQLERAAKERPKGEEIRTMFSSIAPRYDLLNRLLSGFLDVRWRKRAVATALQGRSAASVLDVCTGTGDVALQVTKKLSGHGRVVGADFCPEMLKHAGEKVRNGAHKDLSLVVCDAQSLPFPAHSFDAALVAFGIRNVSNVELGIREMTRVVRPGGRVVVLEFSRPRNPLSRFITRCALSFVPLIGRLVSGSSVNAYGYLSSSVASFGARFDLVSIMRKCGLTNVREEPLTLGAVTVFSGEPAFDPEDQSKGSEPRDSRHR